MALNLFGYLQYADNRHKKLILATELKQFKFFLQMCRFQVDRPISRPKRWGT